MKKAPALVDFNSIMDTGAPTIFDGGVPAEDFDAYLGGIGGSFAVVSFRGKVWRVKFRGEESLMRDRDGEAVRKLQVFIVGASPTISKTYYASGYEPGAADAPDCHSSDGVTPDADAARPQCETCAGCQWNLFGSDKRDNSKGKACADVKRVAVVPASDISNDDYGGPMLLRIPPASLQAFAQYVRNLRRYNVPPFGAVTSIGFEPEAEFPKLTFSAAAVVNSQDVLDSILRVRGDPGTVLVTQGFAPAAVQSVPAPAIADQRDAPVKDEAAPKPKPKPKPKAEAKAEIPAEDSPLTTQDTDTDTDADTDTDSDSETLEAALDDLLAGL